MRPEALAELGAELPRGVTLISATNGKTTTARLVAGCARRAGWNPVANTSGANLLSGVATALLDARGRTPPPDAGLFEVDEAALTEVARQLPPRVLVLMNLFRDQLDRYGELEHLAELLGADGRRPAGSATPVLNADDPAIAALGEGRDGVVTFGIDDPSVALAGLPHAADSTRCRACSQPLHLRPRHARPPRPLALRGLRPGTPATGRARDPGRAARHPRHRGDHRDARGGVVQAELPLPGLHNAYNATAATAAAVAMGIGPDDIAAGLATSPAAFGRGERVLLDGPRAGAAARQEPDRGQRDRPHRAARPRAAAPADRAERPHRRRARRLVDLGRRLRAAAGAGRVADADRRPRLRPRPADALRGRRRPTG